MKYIKDATERVTSTAAQVAVAIGSVEAFIAQTGVGAEHWQRLTAYGVVATLLAVVKVLAAAKVGDRGTASLATEDVVEDTDVVYTEPEDGV